MSSFFAVDSRDDFVPSDRFEVDQFVRVQLLSGRTEIGVVTHIGDDHIIVTTNQGYDIKVPPRSVRRAFLLVLDLNGVLGARGRGSFVPRPHVEEFMKFAFANFIVAVWTSGLERSCNPIIDGIFDGYKDRLLFKRYRGSCTARPTEENPYGTVKNLQRIFDAYPKSFHSVNTIIVDDSPDKCSHPDIALCPTPFQDPTTQMDDTGLRKAMEVLMEVLLLDSHTPLIHAAEERLQELQLPRDASADLKRDAKKQGAAAAASETAMEGVSLWRNRLCCDHLQGRCTRGTNCRYSHDPDDGKQPCSRKNRCSQGHRNRWLLEDTDVGLTTERAPSEQQERFQDNQEHITASKQTKRYPPSSLPNRKEGDSHANNQKSIIGLVKRSSDDRAVAPSGGNARHVISSGGDFGGNLSAFNQVPSWKLGEGPPLAEDGDASQAPRICCDFLRGQCRFKKCRFPHKGDDGVNLCSRNHCPYGHHDRFLAAEERGVPFSTKPATPPTRFGTPGASSQPLQSQSSWFVTSESSAGTRFFSTNPAAQIAALRTSSNAPCRDQLQGDSACRVATTTATDPAITSSCRNSGGLPKELHLTANRKDGRALLRELQAMTQQGP